MWYRMFDVPWCTPSPMSLALPEILSLICLGKSCARNTAHCACQGQALFTNTTYAVGVLPSSRQARDERQPLDAAREPRYFLLLVSGFPRSARKTGHRGWEVPMVVRL